jgi:hypothetical protein
VGRQAAAGRVAKPRRLSLARLRRAFREAGAGDVLATNAPGYVLHAEETDARRFEALAAQGREALAAGEAGRAAIEDWIEAEPSLGRHAALVPELESWWRGSLPGSGWPGS